MSVVMEPASQDVASRKQWVDAKTMADILDWSDTHLYRVVTNNKDFPRLQVGRKLQFNPPQVMEFLAKCSEQGRQLETKRQAAKRKR